MSFSLFCTASIFKFEHRLSERYLSINSA